MTGQAKVDKKYVEQSKRIQRQSGRTFYLATLMFPKHVRHETYILYAFFRKSDEVVDTINPDPNQEQELDNFMEAALGKKETEDPVLKAFNEVREARGIREQDVRAFINSMKMDTDKNRYEDFSELQDYMDGSAAAVGRMMTSIIGPEDEERALPHATSLGEAYQMSNFLRDVEEDINDYGRIYLPQTTLDRFNVSDEEIVNNENTEGLKSAVKYEMERTEELYRNGLAGIKYLPENTQFAILLSAVLYSQHHAVIEGNNYKCFGFNNGISTFKTLKLTAKTLWYWRKHRSPTEVFNIVSCIESESKETSNDSGRISTVASSVKTHVPLIGE